MGYKIYKFIWLATASSFAFSVIAASVSSSISNESKLSIF